jgi:UDP-glucose 4-epimerase
MMKVLLTGGAGYIGSHTLLELLAKNHQILVVDNFDNATPDVFDRIRALSNGLFDVSKIDVRDTESLAQQFSDFEPDAVIHFAGLKAVGESEQHPLRYYDTNVAGTVSVLSAMDQAGCKNIIFSSSATVYGEPIYLPFDEKHPKSPTNVYGHTKNIAEQVITSWAAATADASAVLLRYFNPVGAHLSGMIGENPKGAPNNLMPFLTQVAVGRRAQLSIFGNDYDTHDGTGVRDYIHVVDLAQAHVAALTYAAENQGCGAFNIGTGQGYSVLDMVAAFEKATGQPVPYAFKDRRPGDIACFMANPAKASASLNWTAQFSLQDMCASSWNWQSKNPNGYE